LKEIVIPDSVTTIGGGAFNACNSLETLTIGNNVTIIGQDAFKNCTNSALTIAIPDNVTTIGENAFLNVAEITYDASKMKATGSPWGAKKVNGVEIE